MRLGHGACPTIADAEAALAALLTTWYSAHRAAGGHADSVAEELIAEVRMTPPSPTPAAIRESRAAAGLTQTQAAALIYCTLRGWQDWEAGKRAMHPAFFELFLLKANCSAA